MSKKFQKNVEDFRCEHCGFEVKGNGYTNHCPKCLWSKHVDVNPGDRAANCGGMMKPLRAEGAVDYLVLIHKCEKCGHEKRNKIAPNDDFEALLRIRPQH